MANVNANFIISMILFLKTTSSQTAGDWCKLSETSAGFTFLEGDMVDFDTASLTDNPIQMWLCTMQEEAVEETSSNYIIDVFVGDYNEPAMCHQLQDEAIVHCDCSATRSECICRKTFNTGEAKCSTGVSPIPAPASVQGRNNRVCWWSNNWTAISVPSGHRPSASLNFCICHDSTACYSRQICKSDSDVELVLKSCSVTKNTDTMISCPDDHVQDAPVSTTFVNVSLRGANARDAENTQLPVIYNDTSISITQKEDADGTNEHLIEGEFPVGTTTIMAMIDSGSTVTSHACTFTITIIQVPHIDECFRDPCINGQCVPELNRYTCECSPGWSGVNCELDIDECSNNNQCFKGATCVDGINQFTCTCTPGWTGNFCEINIDECFRDPCINGQCVPGGPGLNRYTCECFPGWSGVNCQLAILDIDECSNNNQCLNGATCVDGINQVICRCAPGWQGTYCKFNIDDCSNNKQCLNDAICVDGINQFTCRCTPGWTGTFCQSNFDDCSSNNQCLNGATCVDGINQFTCQCALGWSGAFCDINTDDCSRNNQCLNDGTCVDEINTFTCRCAPGWTGTFCDLSSPASRSASSLSQRDLLIVIIVGVGMVVMIVIVVFGVLYKRRSVGNNESSSPRPYSNAAFSKTEVRSEGDVIFANATYAYGKGERGSSSNTEEYQHLSNRPRQEPYQDLKKVKARPNSYDDNNYIDPNEVNGINSRRQTGPADDEAEYVDVDSEIKRTDPSYREQGNVTDTVDPDYFQLEKPSTNGDPVYLQLEKENLQSDISSQVGDENLQDYDRLAAGAGANPPRKGQKITTGSDDTYQHLKSNVSPVGENDDYQHLKRDGF